MAKWDLPPVGGYVLAGGKSSRMGQDKALLELAGKPLVEHAVTKLKRLCAEVKVLSGNEDLARYAPVVKDRWAGCGPLGGIEAALDDSEFAWNLILPVDVPFLPTRLLDDWLWTVLRHRVRDIRLAMLRVDGRPHPTLLIVHRDVAPYFRSALRRGEYRVFTALQEAGAAIAEERKVGAGRVFLELEAEDDVRSPKGRNADKSWKTLLSPWSSVDAFANLNTPEEFARAETNRDALDT